MTSKACWGLRRWFRASIRTQILSSRTQNKKPGMVHVPVIKALERLRWLTGYIKSEVVRFNTVRVCVYNVTLLECVFTM